MNGAFNLIGGICASYLFACAGAPVPSAQVPEQPDPQSVSVSEPRCLTYVRDAAKVHRLRAIQLDGARVPAGSNALSLAKELVGLLSDPEPEVRDRLAFELLYVWIREQRALDGAALTSLAAQLEPTLGVPVRTASDDLAPVDPCVYGRSFGALTMSLIASRDAEEGFLAVSQLHAAVLAAAQYAAQEYDLRGFTGEHGWAHAAAHTGDWLLALAKNPRLSTEDVQLVLKAVSDLVLRPHGFVLHHGEDGRLAQPVLALLARDAVDAASLEPWLQQFLEPFREPLSADPVDPLYARQRNARNLLFTLFVSLSLLDEPNQSSQAALAALRKVLKTA